MLQRASALLTSGVVLLILALTGIGAALLFSGSTADCGGEATLGLVTYNVGNVGAPPPSPAEVTALLSEVKPDVVFFQEAGAGMAEAGRRLGLPYLAGRGPGPAPNGLMILSRYPLREIRLLELETDRERRVLLEAQLVLPDRRVHLLNVHLPSIGKSRNDRGYVEMPASETLSIAWRELFAESPRSRLAEEIVNYVAGLEQPVILGGDLNTVPWSRTLGILRAELEDSFPFLQGVFAGTYSKLESPLPSRVDYVLHTGDLPSCESRVIDARAGDHLPVYARLRL
jgi:endonuclease/exonuclease/phosphatase family metal-dependent hydrolase